MGRRHCRRRQERDAEEDGRLRRVSPRGDFLVVDERTADLVDRQLVPRLFEDEVRDVAPAMNSSAIASASSERMNFPLVGSGMKASAKSRRRFPRETAFFGTVHLPAFVLRRLGLIMMMRSRPRATPRGRLSSRPPSPVPLCLQAGCSFGARKRGVSRVYRPPCRGRGSGRAPIGAHGPRPPTTTARALLMKTCGGCPLRRARRRGVSSRSDGQSETRRRARWNPASRRGGSARPSASRLLRPFPRPARARLRALSRVARAHHVHPSIAWYAVLVALVCILFRRLLERATRRGSPGSPG